MLDTDAVPKLMAAGTIEIAPLAYMRGRAQPVSTSVLTPEGFRPIGELRVGDLVTGSDGRPTPVLGVYPQGRKQVYRVTAQDGASTLACGEHLWSVRTASDKRRNKPARVLETREMEGRLFSAHMHRYELPLVQPVQLPRQEVPIDPYALGLLLGDGCLTATTTPGYSTADPELARALDAALPDVDVVHRGGVDYVLKRAGGGGRGGVIIANPVTAALRRLSLAGTRSTTCGGSLRNSGTGRSPGSPALLRRRMVGGVRTDSRTSRAPPTASSHAISIPVDPAPTTSARRPR